MHPIINNATIECINNNHKHQAQYCVCYQKRSRQQRLTVTTE